jgi:hypothetical protein
MFIRCELCTDAPAWHALSRRYCYYVEARYGGGNLGLVNDFVAAAERAVTLDPTPQWSSYRLLLACAAKRPSSEIATLAAAVQPSDDPESNYFSAAHLAYCRQTAAARDLPTRALDGNYCSYPAMMSDPLLATLRGSRDSAGLQAAGKACGERFASQRTPAR